MRSIFKWTSCFSGLALQSFLHPCHQSQAKVRKIQKFFKEHEVSCVILTLSPPSFFWALTPASQSSLPDQEYPSVPGAAHGRLLLSFHHSISCLIQRPRLFRQGIYRGLPSGRCCQFHCGQRTLAPVHKATTHTSSCCISHPRIKQLLHQANTSTYSTIFSTFHALCYL